ncbi:MAG: lytic transglycosylase domain-containing protein [Candidatus Margulisiibacteriota bacterium]
MTVSLIPAVVLAAMILFSGHQNATPNTTVSPVVQEATINLMEASPELAVNVEFEQPTSNSDLDYRTIHAFILKQNKTIDPADAAEISKSLVDSAQEQQIDPKFVAAVIARESSFNKNAISSTGAKGLGQIKDFNFADLKISDPFNIKENVYGTATYLKKQLTNWKTTSTKTPLALASYFKGYGAVKRAGGWVDTKTNGYVTDIVNTYKHILSMQKELAATP